MNSLFSPTFSETYRTFHDLKKLSFSVFRKHKIGRLTSFFLFLGLNLTVLFWILQSKSADLKNLDTHKYDISVFRSDHHALQMSLHYLVKSHFRQSVVCVICSCDWTSSHSIKSGLFVNPSPVVDKWWRSIVISVSVCVFIRDHIFGTTDPNFANSCARYLWSWLKRRDYTLGTSGFMRILSHAMHFVAR